MTNFQKELCRYYARKTNWPPKDVAEAVGCSVGTAKEYIKIFRKKTED